MAQNTPDLNLRIVAYLDGTETDITEGVQTLYDMVIGSMDWGSGFFTVEDAMPVVKVAKACQFRDWERAQTYVDDQLHSQEQQHFLANQPDAVAYDRQYRDIEHAHVFSKVGRCMWRGCDVREGQE